MSNHKKTLFLILIFAIIILAVIFILSKINRPTQENKSKTENKIPLETPTKQEKNIISDDQNVFQGIKGEYVKMIGNWNTECLIANSKKPFAEKHEFIFKENGVAQHWRLSGPNCENLSREKIIHNYKIEIPEFGKINFIALDKNSDTIYDIYKFEGNFVYFGHGPRDWYPLSLRNFGGSLETRFDALNTFLKYKKQ